MVKVNTVGRRGKEEREGGRKGNNEPATAVSALTLQENSLMALFLSQSISLSLSLSFFSSGSTNDEGDVRFSVITCGGACKSTGSHIILAGKYCETVLFIAIISAVVFEEIPVVLLNHIYFVLSANP